MPAPRKIDMIPSELRERLSRTLAERGFGDILAVTDELNFWLESEGLQLSIGKSAVGEFSKALKDQREAFGMAETLLADMDIEQESDMHRVLMQMIATSAVHMMRAVREDDKHLEPKDLMALGRMLKDLMSSVGLREKIVGDERKRITEEARLAERAEIEKRVETATAEGGMSAETAAFFRAEVLGVRPK